MSIMPTNIEYDVAFSFAGAQRDYVEKTKSELSKYKVSVFYDYDNVVDLWGKNLYLFLSEIFSKKARYCVIFISKEYAERPWTNHEFQFVSERAFEEYGKPKMQEYILPVIFDETKIPGLLTSIGYIDAREIQPGKLAEYIAKKVGKYNIDNGELQNSHTLFEHIKLYLENYAKNNTCFCFLKENNIIGLSVYMLPDVKRNIITFQLFENYINLYCGEFLLGINPSAVFFIDNDCVPPSIKLINFSPFFKRISEQNLTLKEFDDCLDDIITTMSEEII